jgi:Protein of unknown function (DUF2442)
MVACGSEGDPLWRARAQEVGQAPAIAAISGMHTLAESVEVLAVDASCTSDTLTVTLSDGRVVSAPLAWFPRLVEATPRQRAAWELIGGGIGLHWEAVGEDISVASLLHPENFVPLPTRMQPTHKKRRAHSARRGTRG